MRRGRAAPLLSSDAVGFEVPPSVEEITARRCLAFAAGVGDTSAAVFDDRGPLLAPPALCVSLEWPQLSHPALRERLGGTPAELLRGLHAGQDSHFARPIRPGSRVRTGARLTGLRATAAGALAALRVESGDEEGPFTVSWVQLLFRGVALDGPDRELERAPEVPARAPAGGAEVAPIPIARELPHVYTECARIWNPIHTERRVAQAAGLPDLILHGSATWALAARELVARRAGGDPARLRRLAGRFRAMVIPGTQIALEHAARDGGGAIDFAVRNAVGEAAIDAGHAEIAPL